jgi:DNA-binding GntR family transcriptional regulator
MSSARKSAERVGPVPHARSDGSARRTGGDTAYDLLRRRILALEIPAGADLDEIRLAASCGVSRTPVREALIRLAADRLVMQLPNRGYVVAPLLLADFPQFIEALAITQGAVSALAAARRSDVDLERIRAEARRFADAVKHGDAVAIVSQNSALRLKIAAAGGNQYFTASYRQLLDESVRLVHTFFAHDKQPQQWIDHHDVLIEAIARQDAPAAERLGRHQAVEFQRQILAYLEGNEVSAVATLSEQETLARPRRKSKAA